MPALVSPTLPPADLHLRSYAPQAEVDSHAYAQLVLPLTGTVSLEIEGQRGHGAQVSAGSAAFVETGAMHATGGPGQNSSLILDLPAAWIPDAFIERWTAHPFMPLSLAAGKLVDFMGLMLQQHQDMALAQLQHWVPLLLDSLAWQAPRQLSRLQQLMARMRAEPGLPWSVADMAAAAHISSSRLHEWFLQETGTSPRAWLAGIRIAHACELLRNSALPLAEIALRCGYADQSALARAMRKWHDTTPSAWRQAVSTPKLP